MTTPTTEGSLISRAKAAAQAAVGDARDELIEISREIHANPELAMEEKRASGLLAQRLEQRGFAVERGTFGLETALRALGRGAGHARLPVRVRCSAGDWPRLR